MTPNGKFLIATVVGATLVAVSPAHALPPLSADHTAYGVSQFWAGHSNRDDDLAIRLRNPNKVTHAALFFVYDRVNEGRGQGESEVFRSCGLKVVTPHASIGVSRSDFGFIGITGGGGGRFYAEVLAAPLRTFPAGGRQTRVADALGITVGGGGGNENRQWTAVNPALFSLPSDRVVEGQRQDAVDCACFQMSFNNLPASTFSDFGVQCQ